MEESDLLSYRGGLYQPALKSKGFLIARELQCYSMHPKLSRTRTTSMIRFSNVIVPFWRRGKTSDASSIQQGLYSLVTMR